MHRLDSYVARRHQLAQRYNKLLSGLPLITPWEHPDGYSGLHLYVIRLQLDKINKTHRQVFEALREQGISVNLHYIPVHIQPYYARLGAQVGYHATSFPQANAYYEQAISLPLYATLSDAQQDVVAGALRTSLA
jgi:dTDP-4-amino-4,6-dideoxygalactose transaminase